MISCIKYNNHVREERIHIKMLLMSLGFLLKQFPEQDKARESKLNLWVQRTGRWLWRGSAIGGRGEGYR